MNRWMEWLLNINPGELSGVNWTFRFVAEYNVYIRFAMWCALGAMAYLTVRSYRREGDAPGRAKAILGALRVAVIVTAFAVLFRPAIVLQYIRTLHSSIVVLVDDSLSMSFADEYAQRRELGEKAASALGIEPARIGEKTRRDLAARALGRPDGPLAKLAAEHPVVLMRFSTTQPGREDYTRAAPPVEVMGAGGDSARKAAEQLAAVAKTLHGNGYDTNIPTAMFDAMNAMKGRLTAALVVVSDGQLTSSDARDRLRGAQEHARKIGLPVYAVAVGDPTPPSDVSVAALRAPSEVRSGSPVDFTAVLTHRNMKGRTVTVRLLQRPADGTGREVQAASASVVLNGASTSEGDGAIETSDKGVQDVTLQSTPDRAGRFLYRIVIEGGPAAPGRDTPDAEAVVNVADEKIRVLLISGDAGWEFQRLRDFLYTQPQTYLVSVWQQNADPEVSQTASTGMKLTHLPRKLEELVGVPGDKAKPGYDVVVLYDPQPTQDGLDETFCASLRKYVDLGGGLCYVAGNKHTDMVIPRAGKSPYQGLIDLLPVRLSPNTINIAQRIGQRDPEAWPVRLTSYGEDHPVMKLGGSVKETRRVYQVLPGFYWSHPVYDVKPAARVLAENANPLRRTEQNRPEPLVAVQNYGMGRVLYLGFDATWRWRAVEEGYFFRRFWNNVVSYLGGLKVRQVVITTGGDRFSVGEAVEIEVEALTRDYRPMVEEKFEVDLVNARTGETETISLEKVPDRPGRYRKTIRPSRTGTFELTALRGDPKASEKVASKRITIELPQAETRRREADYGVMEQVASRPENFLTLGEMDRLAEQIRRPPLTVQQEVPREFWDSRLALLLMVTLLTAEWILRKKYNMA
ncbi:MAG TPA: hypothetical protein DCX07_00280 [Phycisphaerales bacterium]|nr:hypothetical protein [Phycisphaerales bacterium]